MTVVPNKYNLEIKGFPNKNSLRPYRGEKLKLCLDNSSRFSQLRFLYFQNKEGKRVYVPDKSIITHFCAEYKISLSGTKKKTPEDSFSPGIFFQYEKIYFIDKEGFAIEQGSLEKLIGKTFIFKKF